VVLGATDCLADGQGDCVLGQVHSRYEITEAEARAHLTEQEYVERDGAWWRYGGSDCQIDLNPQEGDQAVVISSVRWDLTVEDSEPEIVYPSGADWQEFVRDVCPAEEWPGEFESTAEGWVKVPALVCVEQRGCPQGRFRSVYQVEEAEVAEFLTAEGYEQSTSSWSRPEDKHTCSVRMEPDPDLGGLVIWATDSALDWIYPSGADWREFIHQGCPP
jgi:hypothetical protein